MEAPDIGPCCPNESCMIIDDLRPGAFIKISKPSEAIQAAERRVIEAAKNLRKTQIQFEGMIRSLNESEMAEITNAAFEWSSSIDALLQLEDKS